MYNQYNPWNMGVNMQVPDAKFSKIPKINWGNVLNNTQKTLGIINQAIPIVYQVRPLFNNAKTMFRIAGAINEKPKEKRQEPNNFQEQNETNSNLQFFL